MKSCPFKQTAVIAYFEFLYSVKDWGSEQAMAVAQGEIGQCDQGGCGCWVRPHEDQTLGCCGLALVLTGVEYREKEA